MSNNENINKISNNLNNEMEKGRILIFDENNTSVIKSKYYFEKVENDFEFDINKNKEIDDKS